MVQSDDSSELPIDHVIFMQSSTRTIHFVEYIFDGWLDKIVHFAHYDVYSLSESKNVRKKPSPFCRWSNSGFFDL